jgi:ComF family protein
MILASLTALLFPKTCLGCRAPDAWLCVSCQHQLSKFANTVCFFCKQKQPDGLSCPACLEKTAISGVVAAVPYADPTIRRVLQAFKYQPAADIATDIVGLLERSLSDVTEGEHWPSSFDAIVPVALHARRQRWRGFNQSRLIAKGLEQRFGWPVADALVRTRLTRAQAKLAPDQRQENVADAFTVPDPALVQNRTILLVDDVITTGATVAAAAQALRAAGAQQVWIGAIAAG